MMVFVDVLLAVALVLILLFGALAWFTSRTVQRVQKALPPTGDLIDLNGTPLHVYQSGHGHSVLLIHGLAGQMGNFTYGLVELLAPQFHVVVVDRPGSGYSPRAQTAAADVETQAALLAQLIEQLELGPTLVVGHSLGGAIALALALNHPQVVAGLALVAPLTQLPDSTPAAFKSLEITSPLLRKFLASTVVVPVMIAGRNKILAQVFGPEPVPLDFDTRGGGLLSSRPSHFLAAASDMQALPEAMPALQARYRGLHLPVGVLFGRQDQVLNPTTNGQGLVDQVPGASLQLIDGGHMLPVTCPELTAQFIIDMAQRSFVEQG
ncbi:MAG: alpha/beta hydrolase, partial [Herbaspirillum sp.]